MDAHILVGLSDEDGWSLFKRHALSANNVNYNPYLEAIGKDIVKKCKGLPLAVKTIGGLLSSTADEKKWKTILKSEVWDVPEDKDEVMPALRSSYKHLTVNLNRCFAYCSIFPKYY
uniref:Disease resistance protein RGA3 n=1 Tax=Nelumbo nucifera TaxID=4432 RepID=A0A822ZP04_NELNU|nr:TPA_asm: hypothetical protein HUJ06_003491 [Nelumbo nucifera]